MNCYYCDGRMKKSTTSHHFQEDDVQIMLDQVPAWICRECGQAHFELEDVDFIQERLAAARKKRAASAAGN